MTGSKEETALTATAMAPSTRPPATTEFKRFFNDGVTAASATNGWAIMAPIPTVTPAMTFSTSFFSTALHQTVPDVMMSGELTTHLG